jgi:hypothetical protein
VGIDGTVDDGNAITLHFLNQSFSRKNYSRLAAKREQ